MKERPILFSGEMVRAILDGRKTQTRRMITPREFHRSDTPGYDWTFRDQAARWHDYRNKDFIKAKSPYGVPGDQLWVRETWSFVGKQGVFDLHQARPDNCTPIYRTDGTEVESWFPSIHMPRWASRITLEVTGVRVEQLQDISEEDALAEGVAIDKGHIFQVAGHPQWGHITAVGCFETLWGAINGKRAPWASNPWVWVVEFERIAPEGM